MRNEGLDDTQRYLHVFEELGKLVRFEDAGKIKESGNFIVTQPNIHRSLRSSFPNTSLARFRAR